jgi:hypothetical protein
VTYRRHLRKRDGGYLPLTTGEDAAICGRLMDHVPGAYEEAIAEADLFFARSNAHSS